MDAFTFYKCLADATRLPVVLLLAHEGELCVCELTVALAQSQPKISRHLAHLRRANLLRDRRQGQWVFYRLSETLPAWARAAIAATANADNPVLAAALARLMAMGARPARIQACC